MKWTKPVVDRGWPETWETEGESGMWWTIDKLPDGYRLWQLYDRADYDYGVKVGRFETLAMAKKHAEKLEEAEHRIGRRAGEESSSMKLYQIQATLTVETPDGYRESSQIPTFFVEARSAKSALKKAGDIVDAHELGEFHGTAYNEDSGEYEEV